MIRQSMNIDDAIENFKKWLFWMAIGLIPAIAVGVLVFLFL